VLKLFQSAQHLYDLDPLASGSGSGSGRPKDMRILRIRIPNTGFNKYLQRTVEQKSHKDLAGDLDHVR
jgi:hypothetical protein